jgi:hypothetical protein
MFCGSAVRRELAFIRAGMRLTMGRWGEVGKLERLLMTKFNDELPEAAPAFLEQQAAAADPGRIEAELIKGLESGPARPWSRQDWDSLRQRAMDRQLTN